MMNAAKTNSHVCRVKILFLIFLPCLILSCASYKGDILIKKPIKVFYTDSKTERESGLLLIPDNLRETDKGASVVYMVHGGGWSDRTYEDMELVAESLATHGYIVFNINYRLAPKDEHPAQANDLAKAVEFLPKYLKENHQIKHGDYGLWGYSSGGHTVSYFTLKTAKEKKIKAPKVVATGGAPYDLAWYQKSPYIKKLLGEHRDPILEKYYEASPVEYIKGKVPPFYIYHAIEDNLVEYAQAASFEARLKRHGVPVKFHAISWWGHAFAFIFSDEAIKEGVEYFKSKF